MITKEQKELIRHKIEWEGFDYCFNGYSNWKEIKDKEFQKLRKAYVEAAEALENWCDTNCPE
jgi:hypothetical protein